MYQSLLEQVETGPWKKPSWVVDLALVDNFILSMDEFDKDASVCFSTSFTLAYCHYPASMLAGQRNHSLMPYGLPDILDLTSGFVLSRGGSRVTFSSPKEGRKFALSIDELSAFAAHFKQVVVSESLLATAFKHSNAVLGTYLRLADAGEHLDDGELPRSTKLALNQSSLQGKQLVCGDIDLVDWLWLQVLSVDKVLTATPLRDAHRGHFYSEFCADTILAEKFTNQHLPLASDCSCSTCENHTQAYLHHLYQTTPLLAVRLLAKHNVFYWQATHSRLTQAREAGKLRDFVNHYMMCH